MGTKRPSCTAFDTLPKINTSDRKLQPGGKISRDPSPRPAMTAQSERERDSPREETRRREREAEKMSDRARYKDMDTLERYSERDRGLAPRPRDGEREWRERERRQEESRNGKHLSNVEDRREVKRGMKKGDTFPRVRKGVTDPDRRTRFSAEMGEVREERGQTDRPRRAETDDWERERERARHRERCKEREREEIRRGAKEKGTKPQGRPAEDHRSRPREGYQGYDDRRKEVFDSQDIRERPTARRREKPRPNMGEREARTASPRRRRDGEIYTDVKEREKGQRKEGRRDIRSEGDSDEREQRRERVRDREKEEVIYQQSRSEGDNEGKTAKESDRDRRVYREEDRQGDRDRDRDRQVDRSKKRGVEKEADRRRGDRQGERWEDRGRDLEDDRAWTSDRREDDRRREHKHRDRERKERRDDTTGRSGQSQNEMAPRVPPRAQSSGEWSSDMDGDKRHRRDRDSYEERESRRGGDKDEQRDPERAAERSQRMWLQPQRGKNSKETFVDKERRTKQQERRREEERGMESQAEWARDGRRVKEEPDDSYLEQSSSEGRHEERYEYRGATERETEGVSVDGEEMGEIWREADKGGKEPLSDSDGGIEGGRQTAAERENVTDNTEESDREEEGGSDDWTRSESEGGSEERWAQERDAKLSGGDSFVTVSSGGEDEREDDEDKFEDCQEYFEGGGARDDPSLVSFKGSDEGEEREEDWTVGKEEHGRNKQYVFCVVSQTLPRSRNSETSLSQDHPNLETHHQCSDGTTQPPRDDLHLTWGINDKHPIFNNQDADSERNAPKEEGLATGGTAEVDITYRVSSEPEDTESGNKIRSKGEHPYAEIGTMKRDSQTEKLLQEWRKKNEDSAEEEGEHGSPLPNNPYADVFSHANLEHIQPILDQIKSGAMSPEEVEAIRIRISGAWSMSEEPKRHSQAPHLKWAKNVVREILGHSEEQTVDGANAEAPKDQGPNQSENENNAQQEEVAQGTGEMPAVHLTTEAEQHSEPELEEEDLLEVEGLRGMRRCQADMHADQFAAMHVVTPTYTHADTLLDTQGKDGQSTDKKAEPCGQGQLEKVDIKVKISDDGGDEEQLTDTENKTTRDMEVEMYLGLTNTLYKPNSCPILNYDSDPDLPGPSTEGNSREVEDRMGESEEEIQGEVFEEMGIAGEEGEMVVAAEENLVDSTVRREVAVESKTETRTSSCSFRDLGPEARIRRRGIRKTTERRNGELVEVEEEEGVGRDRRPRIFSTTDDEDDRGKSWGEMELRGVLDTIEKRRRNSRFFNAAQLYQQYSEAAQNFEILRQTRSDVPSVCDDTSSPAPSPPPARRPLPPLPSVPHPHSLAHTGSISSVQSLPLPDPPKKEGRPSSPRLSISLTQSSTLWRELPGVRNSTDLEELTEDQRRLQEVRFEVVTSEASYCRSLDIVVEHFVKSKQLGVLLTAQDRSRLFSRLADVRAISHSFLSKLEERVETDIMQFTVCDIIAKHCQRFKMVYVPYLTNQSYQDATYQRLMNETQGFKRIVNKLEKSPVCQRLPLRSFLVLPFQRITRIKLLVQNIVKKTTPGTTEATQAIKALKLLEKLIQESNDNITEMENIESLVSLNARVEFECRTLPLISRSRRLVREGAVTELMDFSQKETERSVYLHLFNDYLLLSLQKEGGRFTVIDHAPVSDLRAENCRVKLHSLQKNLFRLHMTQKALLLRTDTQSDKLRWISALSRPHPEIDFSAAQDFAQMQCIKAFHAQQPDMLALEKADVILVHQQSSDNWVEGTRLSDRHRGWIPKSNLETITNSRVRQRNLSDALKLTTATAAV